MTEETILGLKNSSAASADRHLLHLPKKEQVISLVNDEAKAALKLELPHVPSALQNSAAAASTVAAAAAVAGVAPVSDQGDVLGRKLVRAEFD